MKIFYSLIGALIITIAVGLGVVIEKLSHKCNHSQLVTELRHHKKPIKFTVEGYDDLYFTMRADGSYVVKVEGRKR